MFTYMGEIISMFINTLTVLVNLFIVPFAVPQLLVKYGKRNNEYRSFGFVVK